MYTINILEHLIQKLYILTYICIITHIFYAYRVANGLVESLEAVVIDGEEGRAGSKKDIVKVTRDLEEEEAVVVTKGEEVGTEDTIRISVKGELWKKMILREYPKIFPRKQKKNSSHIL